MIRQWADFQVQAPVSIRRDDPAVTGFRTRPIDLSKQEI